MSSVAPRRLVGATATTTIPRPPVARHRRSRTIRDVTVPPAASTDVPEVTPEPPARPDPGALEFEAYRRDLTGYCYRMRGSGAEAEDAVQEAMARAGRGMDRFEGRSAVRSWLY